MLRALVVTVFCGGLAAQTDAAARDLAGLLPSSTYAAVQFGGLGACAAQADALQLAPLVHGCLDRMPADVRAEHVDRGLEVAADRLQRGLQRIGLAADDLRALLRQPMQLAVGRLTIEGMGPSLCLMIDQHGVEPAVARCLAVLRQQLSQRVHGAVFEPVQLDELAFEQLVTPAGPSVFVGAIRDCLCVSNSRGFLREIAAVANGAATSFAATTRATGEDGGNGALAALRIDAQRLLDSFAPHLPYEATAWADALGIGALRAVHLSLGGGGDSLRVGLGGSKRGLAKVLLAAPAELAFARACSANTVVFGAGSLDVAGLFAAWTKFAALLPEGARAELQNNAGRNLRRELRRAGTSPEAVVTLANAFLPQVGFAIALEKGALPKPELLLHVGVRDADVVAGLLQEIEQATGEHGLEWRTRQVDGAAIRFCNVRLPDGGPQLSPCYLLRDDGLWFASDAAALVRAVRQAADAETSLAAQPDFAALQQTTAGASGVLHLRLFRAAELGWRGVETWLYPQLDAHRDEIGFGREVLPDAEETARALGTSTLVYRIDDDGIAIDGNGPLTAGAALAAFGAVLDDVLSRAAGRVF